MRRTKVLLLSLVLSATSGISPTAQAAKVYLMGGAVAETNSAVYQGLRIATGKDWSPDMSSNNNCSEDWISTLCPRVAVVTSAAVDSAAGQDVYASSDPISGALGYHDLFQRHGFSPKHVTLHIDNSGTAAYAGNSEGDANLALLNEADVVFFNGGDQARHAKAWFRSDGTDTPLLAALRNRVSHNNVVVAGTSAGTAIMGNPTYGEGIPYGYIYFHASLAEKKVSSSTGLKDDTEGTRALRYFDNGGQMTGFGFVPSGLLVDTHFDARGRLGRLLPAMKNLGQTMGIGVDEDTALYVNGDTGIVYGTHSVFVADTGSASFPSGPYFKVTGAVVSLLTSDDQYNFRTKVVTSSKSRIRSPYYSTPYHSTSIFAAYEITKSMTRIVDTTARYHRGISVAPTYSTGPSYPSGAPTVRMDFYRNASTQGYFRSGQYTAVKVLVDIN